MASGTESNLEQIAENKMFDGFVRRFKHRSSSTQTEMTFSVYLPPQAIDKSTQLPVLYFLSGLTCTDQNFITKSGAQRVAAAQNIILVVPDTSPRGAGIPGEDDDWDFGTGAGFYINATKDPWAKNYRMYDYVVKELPAIIEKHFPVDASRQGICGHSMGGHGALTIALLNPGRYVSATAFSPICNPINCPWGQKAFSNYFGDDEATKNSLWKEHDACELLMRYPRDAPMLAVRIDQGTSDSFFNGEVNQLRTQVFKDALKKRCETDNAQNIQAQVNLQDGYDHSYYFISTFIADHINFFVDSLAKQQK